jgi:hypothetical protein
MVSARLENNVVSCAAQNVSLLQRGKGRRTVKPVIFSLSQAKPGTRSRKFSRKANRLASPHNRQMRDQPVLSA